MHRFFIDVSAKDAEEICITGDDVAHITRVLRLSEDDEITVCDSDGTECVCSISYVSKDEVRAWIIRRESGQAEPPVNITLYQGVAKGDKLDTVVQKCVELGAVKIVPVAMKRSVAQIKDPVKKQIRMQKIAAEASKQCRRTVIPEVEPVVSFAQAVDNCSEYELKLLPYEDEKTQSIKTVLKKYNTAKNICIFIGPEGGFADEEVALAKENGFETVSMGPRILRTETAPLAAITAVMYELGDW
ncbi:MAG: 16S rRNA (uracil(1498)-N(3))-methyltransferase [Clostridia bacterium]|nr:16S rRNA (uracil(1498)-N(3))-methyltransferase [Clostridia bacterium]